MPAVLLVFWVTASGNRQALELRITELESDRNQLASDLAAHESATKDP